MAIMKVVFLTPMEIGLKLLHSMFLAFTHYTSIPDPDALKTLLPPARLARLTGDDPGALFAYGLLALVLERHFGQNPQEIVYTDTGRPHLPGFPLHLSLSHAKTHALCAVSDMPVGCDIETHRPISAHTIRRVLADTEEEADFFAYWTLKESYFKLKGDLSQPFSAVRFALSGDAASGADTHGFLYREIPGCTAAVLAGTPFARPLLRFLSPEQLFSYAAEKYT